MKLTPNENKAVLLMREGGELSRFLRYSKFVTSTAPWVQLGKEFVKLSMPSLEKMIQMGVVIKMDKKSVTPHLPEVHYELTELGKTIEL